jgi:group I intron endonuclease
MHQYHYIYKVTNKVNGKFYIGIHSTNNLEDGYLGSGTAIRTAIEKYGVENFGKEILEFCESRESVLNREKELITEDLVRSDLCYNLKTGGSSGFIYSEEWVRQASERARSNMHKTINSEQANQKRAQANRRRAASGEYSSPERREKLRVASLAQRDAISERVHKNWNDPDHVEYRISRMKEAKKNAPLSTCPHCGLQMKANLTRHIRARHQRLENDN